MSINRGGEMRNPDSLFGGNPLTGELIFFTSVLVSTVYPLTYSRLLTTSIEERSAGVTRSRRF